MAKYRTEITVWWPQVNGVEPHEVQIFNNAELLDISHGTITFTPESSGGEKVTLNGIAYRVRQWPKS